MKVISKALLLCSLPFTTNIGSYLSISSITTPQMKSDNEMAVYNHYLATDEQICLCVDKCFENIYNEEEQTSLMSKKLLILLNKTIETNDENDLVQFVNSNKNNRYFLLCISAIFSDSRYLSSQLYFINILLASDIEIFDCWYKLALTIALSSPSPSLIRRAKDILDYYFEEFSSIDISHALN